MPVVPQRVKPANYRTKFKIQRQAVTTDALGVATKTPTDFINPIWGNITYGNGAVTQFMDQSFARQQVYIETRFRAGVDKSMLLVDITDASSPVTYRIITINDVNSAHEKLAFTCVEFGP